MELHLVSALITMYIIGNLFSLLYSRLFNRGIPNNILCCGIFGFSGKEGRKANLKKLGILGAYNVQRGTDSCGYYYNGHIQKGIGQKSIWTKFIDENPILKGDLVCETFIGHTRKSTSGANTEENAHPHLVGNYVQTHNGVIKNPWPLCTKYKVDHVKIHVDSIGLAHIIQKDGFKVLNEYEGAAALAFTYTDDPTSLYLYHGASRTEAKGTLWEERPLYILKQPEGIYYSSLAESLNFISENKAKAEELPHNIVYRIVSGILTDFQHVVDREDVNIPTKYTYTPTIIQGNFPFPATTGTKKDGIKSLTSSTDAVIKPIKNMALQENYPIEKKSQDVFFLRGRYYRGVKILLDGKYIIDRDGNIVKDETKGRMADTFYFIRGVMMQSKKAFENCLKKNPTIYTDLNSNTAYYISEYSRYPVIALETEGLGVAEAMKNKYFFSGKVYTGCITCKFAKRRYNVRGGVLQTITRADATDTDVFLKEGVTLPEDFLDYVEAEEKDEILAWDEEIMNEVISWSNKIITENKIQMVSELFLMFVDYFNSLFYNEPQADNIIEADTTETIKALISDKVSFATYLENLNDKGFLCADKINCCFNGFSVDELLEMDNRYKYIDFIIPTEEERELTDTENATANTLLSELKTLADQYEEKIMACQALSLSDIAQDIAFTGFKIIPMMKDSYVEVEKKIKLPF